jgi:UPF0176 protein
MKKEKYIVILFYRFARIKNPKMFRDRQRKIADFFNLKGRMLIAEEGVNATLEGTKENIRGYIKKLRRQKFFKKTAFKESLGSGKGFTKLKIKVRPEIVTLNAGRFNVEKETAKTITADQLQKMYNRKEDFMILDLRNEFEIKVGKFEKTISPRLKNFRDLPKKLKLINHLKNKKLVAVCTGGIRCEKATCLLKNKGFKNLLQLKDGIHTYIKKFPGKRFKGSLFVFDNRMTTAVVDSGGREVIGRCFHCKDLCEKFYNDDSKRPSKKIICCNECIAIYPKLRSAV